MPHTGRLYILSSTYTHPWMTGEAGPSFLIHDPALAMRWYLTHEQEDNLSVAVQASDDNGATWQPLPAHALHADTERALAAPDRLRHADHTARLQEALAAEAATWLDRRIRFVPGDDPRPWWPDTPALAAWQLGGRTWALAMGTVPGEAVLTHLAAHYSDPQPEGADRLREAARETLTALALAEAPDKGLVPELLEAAVLLDRLSFHSEISQLGDRLDEAQHRLLGHLATRLPETASAVARHPDPQHPVHQAARTYLLQLARLAPHPEAEHLLAGTRDALTDAAAAPSAIPADPPATAPPPPAIPGFPRQFTDLQAAAAWRVISPVARREADLAMNNLVWAVTWLDQVTAETSTTISGHPSDLTGARDLLEPEELRERQEDARESRAFIRQRLDELNARHALMMHAAVLVDAEQAAKKALHHAAIAAAQTTLSPAGRPPGSDDQILTEHDAFITHMTAAEGSVAHALGEQRQMTRDALHRLFPAAAGSQGMDRLRTHLVDHSGLGIEHYRHPSAEISDALREQAETRAWFNSKDPSAPPVTEEDISEARARVERAEQNLNELTSSRTDTLRAIDALDTVAALAPSPPGGAAARAQRIVAQSRERAQTPIPAAGSPHSDDPAAEQQRHTQHVPTSHGPVRPA